MYRLIVWVRKNDWVQKKTYLLLCLYSLILLHSRVMQALVADTLDPVIASFAVTRILRDPRWFCAAHARPSDSSRLSLRQGMRQGEQLRSSSKNKDKLPQKVRTLYRFEFSKSVGLPERCQTSLVRLLVNHPEYRPSCCELSMMLLVLVGLLM